MEIEQFIKKHKKQEIDRVVMPGRFYSGWQASSVG
jgi:hypothetical protein